MSPRLLLAGVLVLLLAATSCSTGPTPPQPGTPGFYWGAARETWRAGDILKTNDNLQELTDNQTEFTGRARAWEVVSLAGTVRGLAELADAYEAGARANRNNPTPFRKQVYTLRQLAASTSLALTETVHGFLEQEKDPQTALDFDYAVGSAQEPPGVKKIYDGMILQDAEADSLQTAMLQRGVLLTLCDFVNAPDDPAKTLEVFNAGNVKVPREVFLLAAARALHKASDLYVPTRLDNPVKLKALCQQALDALNAIPQTKDTKALADKIQTALKKVKTTT